MKVEVKEAPECKPLPFPKLMRSKSTGAIVLFSGHDTGTVVASGRAGESIGHHAECWEIRAFEEFTGSVTLSNGEG